MARQVLFLQGAGEGTHDDWDSKLVDSLKQALGAGYTVLYPRMPDEASPSYEGWKTAVLAALDGLDEGAILVGHSVGGTVLLHTLAEVPLAFRPGALVLIAPPFIGPGGWQSEDMESRTDFGACLPTGLPIWLYCGSEDSIVPPTHAALYAKALRGLVVRNLPQRDHQLNNDMREVAEAIIALTE